MFLIEEGTIADAALPVEQFKAHLRLGTGFGDEGLQDAVLRGFLRAAIAAIEARTSKVLIARSFSLRLSAWQNALAQPFPVAPVSDVTAVTMVNRLGSEVELDIGGFRLGTDTHCPTLRPVGTLLPMIPGLGQVRIVFDAGMAVDWAGLPADLGQAVMMLAAHYYEYREDTALGEGCMPFGVTSLVERYKMLRLGMGHE